MSSSGLFPSRPLWPLTPLALACLIVSGETLGADGRPTQVVATTEVMHDRPCYTVEFDDGTTLVADAQHQWPTLSGIRTTIELQPGQDRIPTTTALAGQDSRGALPTDPYVAGCWLADRPATRHLPLSVPELRPLLRATAEHRRSVLAGLLGSIAAQPAGGVVTIRANPRRPGLLDFVEELLAAEGLAARRLGCDLGIRYRPTAPRQRTVTAVRQVASEPVRCVEVDNADHVYLAGRSMVPTHNSTLGLDFMRSCSVRHGLASVIFSLEMSKSEIVMRLLSAEAKIRLADMRAGTMTDDDWTRLARRMSEISEAPLFVDDSPNLTMMEIRAKARRLKQRHDLKLIVIDYLQLMSSGKRVESRQQEVSEFSRSLKLLAKELEIPVIAVAQLNRGPEQRTGNKPQMSDLRESGSLEQDADIIILLHRPEYYNNEERPGEADIIVAKHRNGQTRTIPVAFQGHVSRFANMARDVTPEPAYE